MDAVTGNHDDESYEIRRYEPGDGEQLISLRQAVWDQSLSAEWFEWKYRKNPYVDHVPLFVAESDGRVVGTRPFVAVRCRVGEETHLALVATDTMVHPDHRRRGLFVRMTERAIDHYTRSAPSFVFNFPNANSLPGYRKLGWRAVQTPRTDYRVQNPAAFPDASVWRLVGALATPPLRAYLHLHDRTAGGRDDVPVVRREGVPASQLATLCARRRPAEIHVERDEAFYRWRFADPRWDRTRSYLAGGTDDPTGAAVVQTRTTGRGVRRTVVADVVPLTCDGNWSESVGALLDRIVSDHRASDVVVAPGHLLPDEVLTARGFHGDATPPVSIVAERQFEQVVRTLSDDDDGWQIAGCSLADPDDWRLSLCEQPYY